MAPRILLIILFLVPLQAEGQRRDDPLRFVTWPVQDARSLVEGLKARDALIAAGAGVVLVGVSRFDRQLTEDVARATENTPKKFVEEFGNVKTVRPMTGVLFLGALMSGDDRLQDASFTALESIVFANLITNLLKSVVGRARPFQGEGPSSFEPFGGNTSFPSGHTTTVFALVTPFALYYPGVASKSLYVLASATAVSRMATRFHWLSDIMGGAAVGILTSRALVDFHRRGSSRVRIDTEVGISGFAVTASF